ncbi:hypothetical protein TNCV_2222751 [Trichonephila clavipes]|nr:hypothetical protein TNCV_2222751 [Trichonephila clavipes]
MDLVILKQGQVTKTTHELPPSLLTSTLHRRDDVKPRWSSLHSGSSDVLGSNSLRASHEFVTLITRLPWPQRISQIEPQSSNGMTPEQATPFLTSAAGRRVSMYNTPDL